MGTERAIDPAAGTPPAAAPAARPEAPGPPRDTLWARMVDRWRTAERPDDART